MCKTGTVNLYNGQGSGVFLPEAGATLNFQTTYEVDSALIGAGTNLLNGGTFTLNGNINGSNVVMNGANVLAGNTVINSALTWNNGNINAGSVLTVATNGLLALTGGNAHTLYGILTNAGTIQLPNGGGDLNLYGSCTGGGAIGELVNLPGALVDVQGNNSIGIGCGSELVINQGVVRKSGGTGTTTIRPTFNNSGTLDVQTGTVNLYNGQGSGVFLPEAGATLNFQTTYEVDSALIGAGTNLLNGGTFTLNGNINGSNVVMNGANVLAGNTVINSALTWNNGNINAGSVLTVATNGLLALTGGNAHTLYGILTNAGTIQLPNGGGDLNLYGSCTGGGAIGELVNLPGALVDVQGDNSINSAGCNTELVINQGMLRKSGGSGTTYIRPTFNNSGTLDVQTGTVNLYYGQGSGVFLPEAGATLNFQTTYEVDSALTGAGTILLNNGTFTLNGNINGSNVVMNGANLLAGNTVINSALTWNGGYISAGSVVTVATNALLVLASGNGHTFFGILTNAGTIQLPNGGGDLNLYGSCQAAGAVGELVNLPGALVDVQGDNSIGIACGSELVINQGVLRKSGGSGTTYIRPTFNNSGTLDVQTGTVSLSTGQGSGVFLPEAGATLIFPQPYEVDNNLTGAGTILLNGGMFTLNGNINGSNVVMNGASLLAGNTVINSGLTWNNGVISAGSVLTVATNGLLALTGGNAHTLYGILTNAGTIQLPNGGNDLNLYGSCQAAGAVGELVNLPGALVDVQGDNSIGIACGSELVINQGVLRKSGGSGTTYIRPTFNNSGTLDVQTGTISLPQANYNLTGGRLNFGLNSSTDFGQISLSGNPAALTGTLSANLNNGFVPIRGNSFAVLNYGSQSGNFGNFILPARDAWSTNYGATTFTLSRVEFRARVVGANKSFD